jgi:hypothetical protein
MLAIMTYRMINKISMMIHRLSHNKMKVNKMWGIKIRIKIKIIMLDKPKKTTNKKITKEIV